MYGCIVLIFISWVYLGYISDRRMLRLNSIVFAYIRTAAGKFIFARATTYGDHLFF